MVTIPIGKHIVGEQVTRLIKMKAIALALKSDTPGFATQMAREMGEENEWEIFDAARTLVWGPDSQAKTGLLADLASPRTMMRFGSNMFKANNLRDAHAILVDADATAKKGKRSTKSKAGIFVGGVMNVLKNAPKEF